MQNSWLITGALCSFLVAALHIGVIIGGAPAYRYFGAGEEFARAQERGSYRPALITSGIVVVFAVLGVYALSAAGSIRLLPRANYVVLATGIVYTLRGLAVFLELGITLNLFAWRDGIRPQDPWFSAASLLFGIIHILGWYQTK